jgi:hypothetical protein
MWMSWWNPVNFQSDMGVKNVLCSLFQAFFKIPVAESSLISTSLQPGTNKHK